MGETMDMPGGESAGEKVFTGTLDAELYIELMRMARAQLSRSGTMSLDAPSLLHEAYLRFRRQGALESTQRKAFFAYAAQVMRSVVIDYIRERRASKRGGGEPMVTLTTGVPQVIIDEAAIEYLHQSMQVLKKADARAHQVVELRYFGGLGEQEIAELLDVSVPTVKRDWRKARAFLFDALEGPA